MTYSTEIKRSYATREQAFGYLSGRGFLCTPRGWENGRWAAIVEHVKGKFYVTVWLRESAAA
jgi:hypothetical protein